MKLIINADDAGYSPTRDLGIQDGLKKGFITDVSLMTNGENFENFVKFWKDLHRPPPGIHINLTEGYPVSDAASVPSLIGPDGLMLGKMGFREQLRNGHVQAKEITMEIIAQLEKFVNAFGSGPSHVDGHQHVHVIPGVAETLARESAARSVKMFRDPTECAEGLEPDLHAFWQTVTAETAENRRIFVEHRLRSPGHFMGMNTCGTDMTVDRLRTQLQEILSSGDLSDEVCELMVHPGLRCLSSERGCGGGSDNFGLSQDREHELEVLGSPEWRQTIEKLNLELVSFAEVGESL